MEGGFYIYAIAGISTRVPLEAAGIDGNGNTVETLSHADIAAIVSPCTADRYEVTRANTIAHQRVMEEAMERWTILPVRFDTIGESTEKIVEKLLIARYEEFSELLDHMAGKVELGVKALWTDMPGIFDEIIQENHEIRVVRANRKKYRPNAPADAVRLGEMVKDALERKKARESRRLLRRFDGLWFERKVNDVFGDPMILNASFLVETQREEEFDRCMDAIGDDAGERLRLKYVGPIPPLNFVEVEVVW